MKIVFPYFLNKSCRAKYTRGHNQSWAKSVAPTGNFPTSYDPNWNLKILTDHFPTRDEVN